MLPERTSAGAVAGHRKGRVPRALREQQILDVAEGLFLSKGYDDTSIEDICRIADISRPIVYDLHGNKAAIYLACVRRARSGLEEAIAQAAMSSTDLEEQLARGADAYFKVLEDDPRRWELLFGVTGLLGELADALTAERLRTIDYIATLLRSYAPYADPDRITAYANLISGAADQLGRWWLCNRHIPRHTITQYHADFVWSGGRDLLAESEG
jgi:AcrR family transcriptional regulator